MTEIAHNLAQVQNRIAEAALRSGREPKDVTLVAITKTRSVKEVVAAYRAGVRRFGENRVEEGIVKIPAVHAVIAIPRPKWHMVGHVQSRKAQGVTTHFDYIHSVDRLKISQRLSRFAQEANLTLPALLECNISGEESKFGFELQGWEQDVARKEAFFSTVEEILELPGLAVRGLMTIAPFVPDAETVRPVFASLRGLLDALRERFPAGDWRHLSMGMSDDFEVAVEEGSTMVRIGRAIFGARPYK
ncbi:MAG: YggS family pyridoxal phosphate-dependent enzyme [Anaerolineae bacterium]|jgi:pyridoxal phosphate enzyme (YggS family)